MHASAGKEILNYCNRCKLMLSAIIVSTLNGAPAKVQCKTCQSSQKYKSQKPSRKKVAPRSRKSTSQIPIHEIWQQQIKQNESTPQKYSIRAQYSSGTVLEHPKFGLGVVQKVLEGDKVEVLFRYELKILVHQK